MAVIYYKEGEHGSGFVGFRVATTIGTSDKQRQQYFSLNDHSYSEAYRLAHELDKRWKAEAAQAKAEDIINKVRKNDGPHIISQGLRAQVYVDQKTRGGELRTYINPCFLVKRPGSQKGEIRFRVKALGYNLAFEKAVGKYCEIHGLTEEKYIELMGRMPSKTLFTKHLLSAVQQRGYKAVTEVDILKSLAKKE